MNGCDHGSRRACTSVVLVVMRWKNRCRRARERHDLAAVGLLEDRPGERLLRRPERDLAPVQAEDAVEAAGLLEVVRRDEKPATLVGKVAEEPLEEVRARLVDARERLVEEEHRRVL